MTITVHETAVKRITDLRTAQNKPALKLRVTVEGGGCSGFQYKLELTETTTSDDSIFSDSVVTDSISLPFLENAVIKFTDELIGSEFTIENPNAASGCGCGASFSVL